MRNQADLTATLRALGVKDSQGFLDLLGVIQPTAQMMDLAAMGPAVLPPMSVLGGINGPPGALNNAVIMVTSRSKGGSFMAFQSFSGNANTSLATNILETPPTLVAPFGLLNIRIAHQASNAVGFRGHTVGALWVHADSPGNPLYGDTWYLSNGRTLVMQALFNQSLAGVVLVQDVPVPPPQDALAAALP